jgi:hypothetical protein
LESARAFFRSSTVIVCREGAAFVGGVKGVSGLGKPLANEGTQATINVEASRIDFILEFS